MVKRLHPREVLKRRRLALGVSMTQFASYLGVEASTLLRLETGDTRAVTPIFYEAWVSLLATLEQRKENAA